MFKCMRGGRTLNSLLGIYIFIYRYFSICKLPEQLRFTDAGVQYPFSYFSSRYWTHRCFVTMRAVCTPCSIYFIKFMADAAPLKSRLRGILHVLSITSTNGSMAWAPLQSPRSYITLWDSGSAIQHNINFTSCRISGQSYPNPIYNIPSRSQFFKICNLNDSHPFFSI